MSEVSLSIRKDIELRDPSGNADTLQGAIKIDIEDRAMPYELSFGEGWFTEAQITALITELQGAKKLRKRAVIFCKELSHG